MNYSYPPSEHQWRSSVNQIIYSLISSITVSIASGILSFLLPASFISQTTTIIFAVLVYLGLFGWYFVALANFSYLMLRGIDIRGTSKILFAYGIILLGSFAFPVFAWLLGDAIVQSPVALIIVGLLPIIICLMVQILMLVGYKELCSSPTFNVECKKGFNSLKMSCLINMVSVFVYAISVFVNIPVLLLGIISLALFIVSIVLVVTGWLKVRENCPYRDLEYGQSLIF